MTSDPRKRQIAAISTALGDQTLAWFGIRGHDAAALLPIPQFKECYAVSAPLNASKLTGSATMEELTGQRVDLDAYDIDFDPRPEVTELRRTMLARFRHASAVATYRPSHFLDAIHFASTETSEYLGLFKGRQSAFEHKPWVETQLAERGMPTIPWRYVADEYRDTLREELTIRPLILRASQKSGGVGIALVESPEELESKWPSEGEHFVGVAPFLRGAVPLNVGACVFDRETVTLHPGSVQLIGIHDLTSRRFGYCGNDFTAFNRLERTDIRAVQDMTLEVGSWLAEQGYLGAFGVDYLIDGTGIHFTEINPRFQGSTSLSAALAAGTGHVDIVSDHVAAFLGLPPQESLALTDWVDELPSAAHLVAHNNSQQAVTLTDPIPILGPGSGTRLELLPGDDISADPGALMFRAVVDGQITTTGFDLDPTVASIVRAVSESWSTPGGRVTTSSAILDVT